MANHPNRSRRKDAPGRNPTAKEITAARQRAGLSVRDAAALIYVTRATWNNWENEARPERRMHPAFWELFRIKAER